MRERDAEVVISLAGGLPSIAEDYTGERRRQRIGAALDDIVSALAVCPADDLAARAVVALAEGWLGVLEVEEQDALYVDNDEED